MSAVKIPRSRVAPDLGRAFETARLSRGLTRKQMARVIRLPERRIEKIERHETGVTLESLQALAVLPEGKALAARIFGLDFDTQAELHALLVKATELIGGKAG